MCTPSLEGCLGVFPRPVRADMCGVLIIFAGGRSHSTPAAPSQQMEGSGHACLPARHGGLPRVRHCQGWMALPVYTSMPPLAPSIQDAGLCLRPSLPSCALGHSWAGDHTSFLLLNFLKYHPLPADTKYWKGVTFSEVRPKTRTVLGTSLCGVTCCHQLLRANSSCSSAACYSLVSSHLMRAASLCKGHPTACIAPSTTCTSVNCTPIINIQPGS
jgi:hypothetical protein